MYLTKKVFHSKVEGDKRRYLNSLYYLRHHLQALPYTPGTWILTLTLLHNQGLSPGELSDFSYVF